MGKQGAPQSAVEPQPRRWPSYDERDSNKGEELAENLAEAGTLTSVLLTARTDDFGRVTRDIKRFDFKRPLFFSWRGTEGAVCVQPVNLPEADGDLRRRREGICLTAPSTSDIQPFNGRRAKPCLISRWSLRLTHTHGLKAPPTKHSGWMQPCNATRR